MTQNNEQKPNKSSSQLKTFFLQKSSYTQRTVTPYSPVSLSQGSSVTDALILVGGKGTRLRPLTHNTPKPLLYTAGYPLLAHLIARIAAAGIQRIILSTSFKAELFRSYFGTGYDFGVTIDYVYEEQPLGTGGGIRQVLPLLDSENVIIFNGDILSSFDIADMIDAHAHRDADVSLHLLQARDPRAFGCVTTDSTGKVLEFLEKSQEPPTNQINGGCYIFRRSVISTIQEKVPVSVERDVFPRLLSENYYLHGYCSSGYWRDMGTIIDFVEGSSDLVRGIAPSSLISSPSEALIHTTAAVDHTAEILGGSVIGQNAHIGPHTQIHRSIILDGARIEAGSIISDSIVGSSAVVGEQCTVSHSVTGEGSVLGSKSELLHGARLWPHIHIPSGGIRFSHTG